MMAAEAMAANALHDAITGIIAKHTVAHRWVCAGTLRQPDAALLLDEAPGLPLFAYALLDSATLPDPLAIVNATDSRGDTVTVTVPRPAALRPPQAGDRVAVLLMKTRADDAFDGEPLIEAWVIGRLVAVDVRV